MPSAHCKRCGRLSLTTPGASVAGKVCLVTGAGSGIGRATAPS